MFRVFERKKKEEKKDVRQRGEGGVR